MLVSPLATALSFFSARLHAATTAGLTVFSPAVRPPETPSPAVFAATESTKTLCAAAVAATTVFSDSCDLSASLSRVQFVSLARSLRNTLHSGLLSSQSPQQTTNPSSVPQAVCALADTLADAQMIELSSLFPEDGTGVPLVQIAVRLSKTAAGSCPKMLSDPVHSPAVSASLAAEKLLFSAFLQQQNKQ